jgi:hypothetical protein
MHFRQRNHRIIPAFISVMLAVASLCSLLSAILWPSPDPGFTDQPRQLSIVPTEFPVLVPVEITREYSFRTPLPLGYWNRKMSKVKDYDGLEIRTMEAEGMLDQQRRIIYHDPRDDQGYEDLVLLDDEEDMDTVDGYYAFDDDAKRNPLAAWEDDEIQDKKQCRRTSWHRDLPINCNNVSLHEKLSSLSRPYLSPFVRSMTAP